MLMHFGDGLRSIDKHDVITLPFIGAAFGFEAAERR